MPESGEKPPQPETAEPAFAAGENPLLSDSPQGWDRLVEAVGPPSILVLIAASMGPGLLRDYSPEDVFQETLLHAWRDRAACEWRGVSAFRRWLIKIADNRIRDLAERQNALKRGGGKAPLAFSALGGSETDGDGISQWAGPAATTTPSRSAMAREQAEVMQTALDGLAEELREVVRLRLFHDLTMPEVAERLQIGVSAAAHRFRKGAAEYQRRLGDISASRSRG